MTESGSTGWAEVHSATSPFSPIAVLVAVVAICMVCGGATCYRRQPSIEYPQPPVVFESAPSLDTVVGAINRTDSIHQLHTNSAEIEVLSMPAVPRLSGSLAISRPRGLRLQAAIPLLPGAGLDMGSNDSMFWMRVPETIGSTVFFFAGHEAFRSHGNRQILAVQPTWLIDAFGLTHVDRAAVVEGPVPAADGTIRLVDQVPDGSALHGRVLTLDANSGVLLSQELYDGSGRQLASARLSRHEFYPDLQVSLPHEVMLRMNSVAGQPMEMRIDVGLWSINRLLTEDPNLFVPPDASSDRRIDLANPAPTGQVPAPMAQAPPQAYSRAADLRPVFRGTQIR